MASMSVRRDLIEQRVAAIGEVDYASLAQEFGVSEMTIRRDIEDLETRGRVRRILGGAIPYIGVGEEPAFNSRSAHSALSKGRIAEATVSLLKPHETVILDSGSTVLAVAKRIKGRELGLTVVTPSVLAALELVDEPDTTVLLNGGLLRPGELSVVGSEASSSYQRYFCDTFIMGVAGLHERYGLTEYTRAEADVKQAALAAVSRVIVVADHTKLEQVHLVRVAPLGTAHYIVTDAPADHPTLMAAQKAGVKVLTV